MRSVAVVAAVLAAGVAAGGQFQALNGAALMALPGSFEVGAGGAATYTIPIAIPPGTAGMEPKLALSYSSQSGSGLLGVGWSLSGLPAITRCPRTLAQDGVVGGVNYDANDRFCLDGQRLVAISAGTYGADGMEYRTELEGFSKIISHQTAGTGPAWFEVWTKAGIVMQFGNTVDSRIEVQAPSITTARLWAINKATDTAGNYWTVSYAVDKANGDYRPMQVDYTGKVGGQNPYAKVQFNYEDRTDIVPMYHAGSLLKTLKRLKTITVSEANVVRQYQLDYLYSATTQRSRITSVKVCTSSASECLPPTTFAWTDVTPGFGTPTTWAGGGAFGAPSWPSQDIAPRMFGDVNGDGLADLVGFYTGVIGGQSTGSAFTLTTYLGNGAFASPGWQGENVEPRFVLDVNGDGLSDIVGFHSSGVVVALNQGNGTFAIVPTGLPAGAFGAPTWQDQNIHPRFLADVNGDGLPDIVGFYTDRVYVALNTGNGTFALQPTEWTMGFGSSSWTNQNIMPRMLVDVNGDGLPDIVGIYSNGVIVALNTGASFTISGYWSGSFDSSNWTDQNIMPRMLVDVNGDGLPDIVGFYSNGVMVALNTGTSFGTPTYWSGSFDSSNWTDQNIMPRLLIDVNGDGLPDVVGFYSNGVMGALNTGTGFGTPFYLLNTYYGVGTGWQDQNVHPRFLVDVNGDGLPDIVGIHTGGVAASLNTATKQPDLVVAVTSGLGAITTVTYKSLSQPDAPYTKGSGAVYPVADLRPAMYVVSDVLTSNGIGGTYHSTYRYWGAKVHEQGRGFLGFQQMNVKDEQTGIETATTFRQDWPFVGLVDGRVKMKAGLPQLLNTVVNTYAVDNLGSIRRFVKLTGTVETSHDLNGAAMPTVTASYEYNDPAGTFGNVTKVTVSTDDGYTKTTTNTYLAPDTTKWILGRLDRATVTSVSP